MHRNREQVAEMMGFPPRRQAARKPGDIKWNFTKFLAGRKGNAVKRFDPTSDPASFEKNIAALL